MSRRISALVSVALALPMLAATSIATVAPASAQDAREYQYQRAVPNPCPRGLKLAAGACVRTCPAGYTDMGRRCQLRNQSRGTVR